MAYGWRSPSLSGSDFVYLWVDGIHLKVRLEQGRKELVALTRVLHTGIVVSIDGPSYRMRAHQQRSDALRRALHPEARL